MPLSEENRNRLDSIVQEMIKNKESDANIQAVVDDFKSKYGNYPEKPFSGSSGDIPEKTTFAQRIGFGTPEQRTLAGVPKDVEKTLFPRVSQLSPEEKAGPQGITKGVKDVLSLPGRAMASIRKEEGGRGVYLDRESFGRTGAPEGSGPFRKLAESVVRSPVMPVAAATGGATGLLPNLAAGAVANVPETIDLLAEGNLKGAGVDIALNTALDGILFGGGKLISGKLKKFSKDALMSQINMPEKIKKQISVAYDKANDKLADVINKYNLNKVTGSFSKMAKQADEIANTKWKQADDEVLKFVNANPNVNKFVDVNNMYEGVKKFIQSPDSPLASDELKSAVKLVENILEGQKTKGLIPESGLVSLNDLIKIKRDLKKGKDLFRLGTGAATGDPMKVDVYKAAFNKVVDLIGENVPEARKLNTEAKELMWVRDAADFAGNKATKKRNPIFGFTEVVAGSGGAYAATQNPDKALPIIALATLIIGAKRSSSSGRGPAFGKLVGETIEKIPAVRKPIYTGTSKVAELASKAATKKKEEEKRKKSKYLKGALAQDF